MKCDDQTSINNRHEHLNHEKHQHSQAQEYSAHIYTGRCLIFCCPDGCCKQNICQRQFVAATHCSIHTSPFADKTESLMIRCRNLAHTRQRMPADPLSTETNLFLTPPVHPLTRRQLKLVSKNPGSTKAVASGARVAVGECQHQFRHRRWNCSVMDEHSHGGSIFGKILKKGR